MSPEGAERIDPNLVSTYPCLETELQDRVLLRCKAQGRLFLRQTMTRAIPNSGQCFDTSSGHPENRIC